MTDDPVLLICFVVIFVCLAIIVVVAMIQAVRSDNDRR
jgi:flagellar biosynthesis protein FliQ